MNNRSENEERAKSGMNAVDTVNWPAHQLNWFEMRVMQGMEITHADVISLIHALRVARTPQAQPMSGNIPVEPVYISRIAAPASNAQPSKIIEGAREAAEDAKHFRETGEHLPGTRVHTFGAQPTDVVERRRAERRKGWCDSHYNHLLEGPMDKRLKQRRKALSAAPQQPSEPFVITAVGPWEITTCVRNNGTWAPRGEQRRKLLPPNTFSIRLGKEGHPLPDRRSHNERRAYGKKEPCKNCGFRNNSQGGK